MDEPTSHICRAVTFPPLAYVIVFPSSRLTILNTGTNRHTIQRSKKDASLTLQLANMNGHVKKHQYKRTECFSLNRSTLIVLFFVCKYYFFYPSHLVVILLNYCTFDCVTG